MLTVISLGAGVQSSTMALMAAHGEITPMPDGAIFADTQAEPAYVYEWLDWLEKELPFPVYRVSRGDLAIEGVYGYKHPPFFTRAKDGSVGMLRRQCTGSFKIEEIEKKLRELLGLRKRQRNYKEPVVESWIGISSDEIQRMKMSRKVWIENRFPLIEKRMTRLHCLEWMRDRGYNQLPRKSACTFCPYHDNATWRDMKANDPSSWEAACKVDEAVRSGTATDRRLGVTDHEVFVHSSATPLRTANLIDPAKDQQTFSFMDECEGMCGV